MGIKIKYTDPSINEFATDDIIINVESGSLFFKSNTNLYKLQGDNLNTPTTESGGDMWVRSGSNLYYTDGKVGIGTTAPVAKLDISGSAENLRIISTTAGNTHIGYGPGTSAAGNYFSFEETGATYFRSYNGTTHTTRMFISGSGNVGIGTTAPTALLHLGTQGSAASNTNPSLTRLALTPPAHTGGPWNFITRDSNTHAFLDIDYGVTNKITINSDGDMGIGIDSPGEKLEVVGNISASGVGIFGSLDISGNIDVDGTTNLDVVDIDGTANMASTLTMGSYIQFPNVNWNDSTSGTVLNDTHILNTALSFPLTGDGITLDYGAKSSTGDNSFVQFRLRDNTSGDSFRVYFDDYQGITYDKVPLEVFGNKVLLCQDNYGYVGIYTNSPIAPLTVRGDIASGGVSTGGTDQIVIHSTTNAYGAGIGFCDHVVANQTYANGQKGHLRFFHSDAHNDTGTGCVFKLSHENATSLALDVEGNVVCATLTCTTFDGPSDINLKTNVNNIDTPLETILKLKGITFEWKEKVIEKEPGKRYTNLEGTKHGFIAQEVEKVLPDLINDEKPYKSLNYIEIIPILVEAMKEQQKQIDELKRKINEQ